MSLDMIKPKVDGALLCDCVSVVAHSYSPKGIDVRVYAMLSTFNSRSKGQLMCFYNIPTYSSHPSASTHACQRHAIRTIYLTMSLALISLNSPDMEPLSKCA